MTTSDPHNLKNGINILVKAVFEFWNFSSPVDFFPAIAILFFFYKIIRFYQAKEAIASELKFGIARLAPFKRNEGELPETIQKITKLFNGHHISRIWDEFKESLVICEEGEQKKYRNTLDSGHFFNYDSICRKLDFFTSVPGILTGLAILGTFIGIIYGIHSSEIAEAIKNTNDGGSTEKFGESIGIFLKGLGDAFGASVWGLALALVFTFVERISTTRIEELISELNHRINLIFPRQTSEELLLRLVTDSQSQLSALHSLANDIPAKIVGCLIDGGVNTVEISSNVQKGIQSGFEGLGARLKELNEFHDRYFNEVKLIFDNLKTISDSISASTKANEVISKNSETTATILMSAGESIIKASGAAGSVVDSIKSQSDSLATVGRDFQAVAERMGASSKEMASEVKVTSGHFKEQSEALASAVVRTSDGLKSGFKAIDEHMGSVVNQLGGVVGGVNKYLEILVERVSDVDSKLNQKAERSEIAKIEENVEDLKKAAEAQKISKVV